MIGLLKERSLLVMCWLVSDDAITLSLDWTGDLSSVKGTLPKLPHYSCLHYDFPRLYLLPMYPCWHTQVNVPDWFTALPPLKHSSVRTHSKSWLSQSASSGLRFIPMTCMCAGAYPGFPVGGGANPPGGRQHMILPKFAKNCMKLRTFWAVGEGTCWGRPSKSCHWFVSVT